MKLAASTSILLIAILTLGFFHFTRAQTAPAPDPINARLDQAKSDHEDALYAAQESMQDAFDAQIKLASDMNNPDGAKALQIQQGDFTASQKMPPAPVMQNAVRDYQDSIRQASATLTAAYDKAIADYTSASQPDQVAELRRQRHDFLAAANPAPAAPATLTPDTIKAALDKAKDQHALAITAAREDWAAAIDTRINAVAANGDLQAVKDLRAAKAVVLSDGVLPQDMDDPDALAGQKKYDQQFSAADNKLSLAYTTAIQNLTRLHQFDAADLVAREKADAGFGDSGKAIDLLKMVDLDKDVVNGNWRMHGGVLNSDATANARIEFPYIPPAEYDFRIVFTRLQGDGSVCPMCTANNHPFMFGIARFGNVLCALSDINGQGDINPTSNGSKAWLINGQEYTSVVKVRKDGIRAYLNDKLICRWATDYQDIGLDGPHAPLKLRRDDILGIETWESPTDLAVIQLIEITGHGKKLR